MSIARVLEPIRPCNLLQGPAQWQSLTLRWEPKPGSQEQFVERLLSGTSTPARRQWVIPFDLSRGLSCMEVSADLYFLDDELALLATVIERSVQGGNLMSEIGLLDIGGTLRGTSEGPNQGRYEVVRIPHGIL